MLTKSVSMDLFLEQLLSIAKSAIFKRTERADALETVDSIKDSEKYITAIEMGDQWSSYLVFNYSVLAAAGLSNSAITNIMNNGKDEIPYELRDLVCSLQREYIISNYKEKNNYYRMLNGEPDIEDEEAGIFVYAPPNEYGIPTDVPIHQLNEGQIEYFNSSGMREEVYKSSGKEYVLHQGIYKISYYKARIARNYDLLYITKAENDSVTMEFIRQYAASRDYIMMGLYTKEDQRLYDHYDSFMGFMVMAMALQRTISCVYQQGITRDFFDNDFIKHLFDAYNIPYIDTIDIPYQKMIAKKLNILLQKKSSDAVLFDITELFDYNKIDIYRYYLVKDYKKDDNGDPIIIYRKVVDEDGNIKEVVDYDKTFDIYFQKVNIKTKDPAIEIADPSNRVPYNSITGDDPYWLNDSDLINKIYNNKFNSILTKYLCIDISYELAKLMYESTHLVRMIIDDQEDYKLIKINLPYANEPVSLFDTILFLCALSAKKIGMAGSCPIQGYQIAQVYGFNFKQDIDLIRNQIIEDVESCTGFYKEVNLDILNYLNSLNATTLEGARAMFDNIEALREWLDTAMRYCNNIRQYRAYRKLYQAVLVVEDVKELYTKSDGTFASTFAELLADRRPDLKEVLDQTNAEIESAFDDETSSETETNFSINNKINRVLLELSKISEELKDIKYSNDKSAIVANIEKVINQMKSYTVDQTASSILYLIKDPHITMLKVIDDLIIASRDKVLKDKLEILFQDILSHIIIFSKQKEKIEMDEWIWEEKIELFEDFIHIVDEFQKEFKEARFKDIPIRIDDIIHESHAIDSTLEDLFFIDEKGLFRIKEIIKEYISLNHQELIIGEMQDTVKTEYVLTDVVQNVHTFLIKKSLIVANKVFMDIKREFEECIHFNDEIDESCGLFYIKGIINAYDIFFSYITKLVETRTVSTHDLLPERRSILVNLLDLDDELLNNQVVQMKDELFGIGSVLKDKVSKEVQDNLSVKTIALMERFLEFRDFIKLIEKLIPKKIVGFDDIFATIDELYYIRRNAINRVLEIKDDGIFVIRRYYTDGLHIEERFWAYFECEPDDSVIIIDNADVTREEEFGDMLFMTDDKLTRIQRPYYLKINLTHSLVVDDQKYNIDDLLFVYDTVTNDNTTACINSTLSFIGDDTLHGRMIPYKDAVTTKDIAMNLSGTEAINDMTFFYDGLQVERTVKIGENIRLVPEHANNQKLNQSDYYVKNASTALKNTVYHSLKRFDHSIGIRDSIRKIYEED